MYYFMDVLCLKSGLAKVDSNLKKHVDYRFDRTLSGAEVTSVSNKLRQSTCTHE